MKAIIGILLLVTASFSQLYHYRNGNFFLTVEDEKKVADIPFYYGIQKEKKLVFKAIVADPKTGKLTFYMEWVKL